MSVWTKICGNTSLEDALVATDEGADALGFVFAPSPRQVTVAQVKAIACRLPASVEKIGVFVDSTIDEIEAAVHACGLTGIQLHRNVELRTTADLRTRLGQAVRILRVMHFGHQAAADGAFADSNIDALLIDSHTTKALGGTGVPFDWHSGRELFQNGAERKRLVLAGGLTPTNVSEAISMLHPWGVDVVSGVESKPGRKDPEKVRSFIAAVRSTVPA